MSTPAPKYPDFNKSYIRKELRAMTLSQILDIIAYHQQKAGVNQRIVAIAKLVLKEKRGRGSYENANSSNTNSGPEQPSDSSDNKDSQ